MFTPESLLNDALRFEAVYLALLKQFPSGTYNEERNTARRNFDDALFCAAWMEQQGIEQLPNVGPFMTMSVSKGQQLRLKRGATIFGTGSGLPREGKQIVRTQVIKTHYVDAGYVDRIDSQPRFCQGKVHWVGPNGYWRWSDINNFDLVEPTLN